MTAAEDAQTLSIPDSDEDDDQLQQKSASVAPELLIDPSVMPARPAPPSASLPSLSAPQSVLSVHPYFTAHKHKMVCQQPSQAIVNHNAHISAVLERLEEMNAGLGDKWSVTRAHCLWTCALPPCSS